MKRMQRIVLVATALAVTALAGAGGAAATTLEVTGVTKNSSVSITASLESGTTSTTRTTSGSLFETCTGSTMQGNTETPYTGTKVTWSLTSLTFGGCSHLTTVHNPGKLFVEHIPGTTNGTVYSEETEVTFKSTTFGVYLNCTTGSGTHIGSLTGVKHGHATLHISAVLNCGIIPSSVWEATYVITSPTDLGISA